MKPIFSNGADPTLQHKPRLGFNYITRLKTTSSVISKTSYGNCQGVHKNTYTHTRMRKHEYRLDELTLLNGMTST